MKIDYEDRTDHKYNPNLSFIYIQPENDFEVAFLRWLNANKYVVDTRFDDGENHTHWMAVRFDFKKKDGTA